MLSYFIMKSIKKRLAVYQDIRRDPRYVFIALISAVIFTLCFLQVRSAGLFDSVERPVFLYINHLPRALYDIMYAFTQLGGLGGLVVWLPLAWYLVNRRAAITVGATGLLAWSLAKVAKVAAHRGRPHDLIAQTHLFAGEKFTGFGFPSGHATVSAAIVTVLYFQVSRRYRKYLLATVFLVGFSRMYLGAHFPLDIIGGWSLGALIGAVASLLFGISAKGLSVTKLKKFLNRRGLALKSLKFAAVDARGSQPLFMTTEDGTEYFGKLFGKQEHAADWLFKLFRLFRYKNLQAEEPHFNSRRNVEIEAFVMLWARQHDVRVAEVIDIRQYGSYWLLLQQRVDGMPLSEHGHLTQKSLIDAWAQVGLLHDARVAHRDLRAANILVDKQGKSWIIDYGFAEASAAPTRLHMDTAELLMSMTLVAGVDRTVAAASAGLGIDRLARALPYLQKAVFSGATTKLLKKDKRLLGKLKAKVQGEAGVKDEVESVDIVRVSKRKIINLILLAVFIYVIAPQFSSFRDAVRHTHLVSIGWFIPLAVASMLTYVCTGIIYVVLANVPLRIRDASLVQLAASFVSKIVPGGLGGTTLNTKYMTRAGMDAVESSAVIAMQTAIGFIMFIVPLGLFLALNGTNVFKLIHVHVSGLVVSIIMAVLVVPIVVTLALPKWRAALKDKLQSGLDSLRNISTPPRELALASITSLCVTALYVVCLYAALQSVGVHIGASQAILAYATAVLAKSAVPTPGGLGPVEAALIGSLLGFGVDKSAAISAVLIYRLATFWIPVPFSLLSYRYINQRKLV